MEGTKRGAALPIHFACLVGVCCGVLFLQLQLSDAARESAKLIDAGLMRDFSTEIAWTKLALQLITKSLVPALAVTLLGLWPVGQPFLLAIYALWGFLAGCSGIGLLLSEQNTFLLMWYLPFCLAKYLTLAPLGSYALRFGVSMLTGEGAKIKTYLLFCGRQALFLLLACVLAAACWHWYGCGSWQM